MGSGGPVQLRLEEGVAAGLVQDSGAKRTIAPWLHWKGRVDGIADRPDVGKRQEPFQGFQPEQWKNGVMINEERE